MKYETVIGIEIHVQVKTQSKMFCSCANRFNDPPNSNVCPVCMGYPGVLPITNKEVVRKAIIAGMMSNCKISKYNKFDRKSYFYPDQTKNYQISQYDLPICYEGFMDIQSQKGFSTNHLSAKKIMINRIHMEEDPAKLNHFSDFTGVDYNRAGVPLLEIVSEPDMASADEAYAYLMQLKQIMQYAGVSDCDMEKGQMRCDINVSLRRDSSKPLGTKSEVKNLNSFRAAHRAILYEEKRQAKILDEGGVIRQDTRGWNDEKSQTYLMRTKENENDYRYFPEPDLTPLTFTDEYLEKIRVELPETPAKRKQRYINNYELPEYDAAILTQEKAIADYFEKCVNKGKANPKSASNWIMSELLRELSNAKISVSQCKVCPIKLGELLNLVENATINGKIAKQVFIEMFNTGNAPEEIIKAKGLVQVTDTAEIDAFVDKAINDNPAQVQQYKEGKANVLQYFVGQVMKLSRGKANPKLVIDALKKKLQ